MSRSSKPSIEDMASFGVGKPGSHYEENLKLSNTPADWFTIADCIGRLTRVILTFYVLLVTHPVSFLVFFTRYNMLWESNGGMGKAAALITTVLFYPIYPAMALIVTIVKRALVPPSTFSENVFFMPPKDGLSAVLWEFYKALSPPMAQFLMNRGDSTAIAHSWFDWNTDKVFWRSHLEAVGAPVPRELGRWTELSDGSWGIEWFHEYKDEDIVIKLKDESNGIGDAFLLHGTGKDQIKDSKAIEHYMQTKKGEQVGCGVKDNSGLVYNQKEALVLEWVRPSQAGDAAGLQEVHTLDIMTVAMPDGTVEVWTVLYWGDCQDGKTSHTTNGGYVIDVANEEISGTCAWYAPYFANMVKKRDFSTGHSLPGVANACKLMVECHKNAMKEQPFLKMIGWDLMLARKGIVYFEGNYAQMRLPRRVFLSWGMTLECLKLFTWTSLSDVAELAAAAATLGNFL